MKGRVSRGEGIILLALGTVLAVRVRLFPLVVGREAGAMCIRVVHKHI